MIWIEFRRDAPNMAQSSVFLGEGERIRIEVHTDPKVAKLKILGKVRLPGGTVKDLEDFQDCVTFFMPSEEGPYRVEVTVEAEEGNYRPSHLSATFYYRKEEPTINEFDHS
jgi:hypothetical protein